VKGVRVEENQTVHRVQFILLLSIQHLEGDFAQLPPLRQVQTLHRFPPLPATSRDFARQPGFSAHSGLSPTTYTRSRLSSEIENLKNGRLMGKKIEKVS